MNLRVEIEREDDGRWIAEMPDLPGVLAYGSTRELAVASVKSLASLVVSERMDHEKTSRDSNDPFGPGYKGG